ncbi:MAG: selenoprotein B glycine/betaine/sarcosine/D-proline reductase [Rhizobiales bacterium]|nr:selenoprotein B glycine/betaine/sarcosine/D-proline reductase [Hyphomicrobiales bacterium]
MVHLREMPEHLRDALVNQDVPTFDTSPWADGPPLNERGVALISSAGLHRRDDPPFTPGAGDYRIIPDDSEMDDLVMSHISTNFDRTGYFQDINVVFPIERLRELRDEGVIGSVAARHFSFMGATPPEQMEPVARDLAGILKQDNVDAVVFCPV